MGSPFIWYELMTDDSDAAIAFYEAVVGWSAEDMRIPEMGDYRYTILSAGGRGVGGLAAIPEECASFMQPGWFGYVHVADTDAAAASIEAAGGRVLMAPADIPTVGRFAMVADPTGAAFFLLSPLPREDAPPPLPRMSLGNCGWHELHAGDGEAAWNFYAAQFGWAEVSRMDMGAMGIYRLWSPDGGGGEAVGGKMTRMARTERPMWLFYFVVDSVDAAAERIAAAGGTVTNGPMAVPDGSWIVRGTDPQGATFALVSQQR
jgi:predicted enzyme related to lactoylglutathione lyase